ncbi:MAG: helix-turn-helix domain-containing protein [Planctomycetaceae bacterium]|jgi:hypothetical protein|nr:helix-turn-helix domain-containing protein [Planctomycetaceae bacterium]
MRLTIPQDNQPIGIVLKPKPKPVKQPIQPIAVCAKEAAAMLNISTITLAKITTEHNLPHKKIGRKILYDVESLKKLIGG